MPKARDIAESALRWCNKNGGSVPKKDMVSMIAKCGTGGKYKSNCERDLHRVVRRVANALEVPVHQIDVRLWSHKDGHEYVAKLPILWPDELVAAIYARGVETFTHCFAPRLDEIAEYWSHLEQHCPWFASHPARNLQDKRRLLPFCLYGDEINAFRNVENGSICVMGFGSDLSYGNAALERYFLITAFSEHNSTDNTFDDILRALVPRLQKMFTERSHNWCTGGWAWTYSSTQGDLKYITDRFHLHNFRKNPFCDLCACKKKDDNVSMTLADFRENAAYRDTLRTHEDYIRSTTPITRDSDLPLPLC